MCLSFSALAGAQVRWELNMDDGTVDIGVEGIVPDEGFVAFGPAQSVREPALSLECPMSAGSANGSATARLRACWQRVSSRGRSLRCAAVRQWLLASVRAISLTAALCPAIRAHSPTGPWSAQMLSPLAFAKESPLLPIRSSIRWKCARSARTRKAHATTAHW